jgi:hypothetical protein
MTTTDPKRCGRCRSLIFPRLVAMGAGAYSCGHPMAARKWACWCGEKELQPVERCPYCVGSRPPKGGDDV